MCSVQNSIMHVLLEPSNVDPVRPVIVDLDCDVESSMKEMKYGTSLKSYAKLAKNEAYKNT